VFFVFVDQCQIALAEVIHLGLKTADHLVAVLENVAAIGGVVAEDADQRSGEKLGHLHGNFEPLKVLGPWFIDFDLPNGRTYADHAQAICGELIFDFIALFFVEIEHVFFEDAAQLEVSEAILLADLNLFIETWRDFVSEASQFQQENSLIEKMHGIVGFGRANVKQGQPLQFTKAFTVIELLVVIGIITILLAILLPAAEHVRHQAYIDKCASNLRQIGMGLSTYAQDNHGNYPRTIYDPTYANPLVAGTGVNAIDPFQPGGVQPNDLTAPVFLLMKNQHLPPALFICPYNDDTSYVADSSKLDGRSNFTNQKQNLAYSFANPYPNAAAAALGYRLTTRLPADFAVAADRNPGVDIHDNVYAPVSAKSPQSLMNKANSDNHEQDGQNVLYGDGHVSWHTNPFCGMQQDNIFTARNDPSQVTASPVDANDSVLLPTDD
jgi:prepilin-type processing-associated H-X9-DG protein